MKSREKMLARFDAITIIGAVAIVAVLTIVGYKAHFDSATIIEPEATETVTVGAGREETAQISTETTEAVEDTTETAESETEAQTQAESTAETEIVTEIETEAAVEAVEAVYYEPEIVETEAASVGADTDCPLPASHYAALCSACAETGVPFEIAMALIYTESGFDAYAVNPYSGCFGYCQLHPLYFDSSMSPEDNIRCGIGLLGDNLQKYGDLGAAITAYAVGHDNGDRSYASLIMTRAYEWGWGE